MSAHKPEPTHPSTWSAIKAALRGEEHDYTREPLNRAVLLLAIPMVLEMLMESLFVVADVFWASRLGKEAVAVVGITESVMTIIYSVAVGLSAAGTAMVARRIGEGNRDGAAIAAGQVLLLGGFVSVALGVALGWWAPEILRLMGASESVVTLGTNFARIMLGGNLTVFMIFLINAVFRGAGDAVIAMRTLWLANAINIVLGPCFIFGWGPFPEWGVMGAAVATNIGRGCGVLYQVWHLVGRAGKIRLHARHFRPHWDIIKSAVNVSTTGVLQHLVGSASWIGMLKILSVFGSAALAGYTIALRLVMFAFMPAWGLSNAGATLVGQNLGAGHPERAEQAVWLSTKYNTLFLANVGFIFGLFAHPIVGFFSHGSHDPTVTAFAVQALQLNAFGFPLFAAAMCFSGAFNGAGDTRTPTLINFISFWIVEIPLAYVLAMVVKLGPLGVFIANPLAMLAMAGWSGWLFRRGTWKRQKV